MSDAPDWGNFWLKLDELLGESERACVLVCGATIESGVADLLRVYLTVQSGSRTKRPLKTTLKDIDWFIAYEGNPAPPLASIVVQARFLRLVGVLDDNTAAAIRAVARIRNRFAHRERPEPLSAGEVKDIRNLLPKDVLEKVPNVLAEVSEDIQLDGRVVTAARANFATTLILLAGVLWHAVERFISQSSDHQGGRPT